MKQLLIIQNSNETPPGTTIEWCKSRAINPHLIQAWTSPQWPDPREYLGVVICGGGMNVDQEQTHPWLRSEKALIRSLLEQNVKTLGLCLGAQLIAEALGARVGPHTQWEVGWHDVELKENIFFKEQKQFKVFQWHKYTFDIPNGALHLSSSEACSHQAFSYGENVLAFQFHPESTREWVIDCATDESESYPSGDFVETRETILSQLQHQVKLQDWYWSVLDRFFLGST
ncbi:MAG: hypothetical protein RJB66_288 [Pseudomonadota bacterium]|jgi:GMP synthase-like glutamine amidotransferase